MSPHPSFQDFRLCRLAIAGLFLVALGINNSASGATIPLIEDFSTTAPDFTYSNGAAMTPTVGSGVLTIDAGGNASGQATNALVSISDATARLVAIDVDITPTVWVSNGGSSTGFLAYTTNPAAGAFPSGANSGYLADIVFPTSAIPGGVIRIFDLATGLVTPLIQSAPFATGSLLLNETYHLSFTSTPRLDGLLDLSLTIIDTTGTLIDADGIVTITGTTPALASTGTFFGLRHRVGSNGATSTTRTFDATYDNFSIVPEPSTYVLGGIGLVGLAFVRKRRSN